jgi:SH3-like domain-containing protein
MIGLDVLKCTRPRDCTRYKVACSTIHVRALSTLGAVALVAVLGAPLAAQSVATRDAQLLAAPGDRPVATIRQGAALATGDTQRGYTQATVDGWIAAALLEVARDSFPLTVKGAVGARLRASANPQAPVVADLRGGMGLNEVERRGAWVHVRRAGWLPAASIGPATAIAAPVVAIAPPSATASTDDTTRNGFVLTPIAATTLAASPGGDQVGSLAPGARTTVTARERGWVRVRVEGWVREADLSVADTALRSALSAADLRADPDATAGRLVHWDVEVLAHQIADPLRKGLVDQEPYLLAQGPAGENALLYLAIPPGLAATAREIPDLGRAIITARVRAGRSEPVGVPVLELLTIVGR